MSSLAVTISQDRDVRDAAEVLHARKTKRLPVVDQNGKLVGIITRPDIVRVIGKL